MSSQERATDDDDDDELNGVLQMQKYENLETG